MNTEQGAHANRDWIIKELVKMGKPLLLPNGKKIYLNDEPAAMIIELLAKAKKEKLPPISREDIIEALKPKYPYVNEKNFRTYLAQTTFSLKPANLAIIGEVTRLTSSKGSDRQRLHRYTLGTIEQKKTPNLGKNVGRTRKTYPNQPKVVTSLVSKPPARFELPGQKAARLEKEEKVMEEARKIFINKFSSVIVTQIANNPGEYLHRSTDPDKDLETFLEHANPRFRELIGKDSEDYLRDFFVDALFTKLTQWWEVKKLNTVPALEQSAVTSCIELKNKGFNIEDVLNKASKRFSIPIASVEPPKSPHIFSRA